MEANNMKALREACCGLCSAAFHVILAYGNSSDLMQRLACEVDKARLALDKPPRNCDVYDAKTAEKEFIRQTGSKSIRFKSVRWLYAPATEKEGCNDGK